MFCRLFVPSWPGLAPHNPGLQLAPGAALWPNLLNRETSRMSFSVLERGAVRLTSPWRQRGSLAKPLLALLALAILGASATAITYLITARNTVPLATSAASAASPASTAPGAAAPGPAAPPAPSPPLFMKLEPFTVTIANDYTERLMHVGVTLNLSGAAAQQRLTEYLPVVRSRILLLLSDQDPDTINTAAAKKDIERAIRNLANAALDAQSGQRVNEVLFTDFVVQ